METLSREKQEVAVTTRVSKPTVESTLAICKLIREGIQPEIAAQSQGLDPKTFYSWLKKSRKVHRAFQREVRQAVAEARIEAHRQLATQDPAKSWALSKDAERFLEIVPEVA